MQKSLFENTTFDSPQKPALRICDVVCSCGFLDESPKALFFIEQIDTVDRLFVGSADDLNSETLPEKEKEAFKLGVRLVDAIRAARSKDLSMAS